MALAATNDYEDALLELESAVAILRRTVDADRGNARLLRNHIDDMEESWLAFKEKMRNYIHKGTFAGGEAKDRIKAHYEGKKEACGILRTTAEELHLVDTGERDTTKREKILVVKQQQQNLMTRFIVSVYANFKQE